MSLNTYFRRAFPKPEIRSAMEEKASRNIIEIFKSVSLIQYGLFISGYLCWVCDAFDFYLVSLTIKELSIHFGTGQAEVTQALTLSLLFRPFGAIFFGLLGDRYGRKWPLVANMLLLASVELMTVFVKNYTSFLVIRSIFGVGMGGVWGLASSCAMENLPVHAKGLFSGIFQPGFSVGVILSVFVCMGVLQSGLSFIYLFYISSGFSFSLAVLRAVLPESQAFIDDKNEEVELSKNAVSIQEEELSFFARLWKMLRKYWLLCLWTMAITSGLSGLANGCQSIYPILLTETKQLGTGLKNLTIILGNLGGITGPFLTGYLSQIIGRKLMIVLSVIFTISAAPLAILPSQAGLLLFGYVLVQAGFQGAWGIAPIYLYELAPEGFKAFFPGVMYQLGVMIASPAANYEGAYADSHRTANGQLDYGTPMIQVMIFCSTMVVVLLTLGWEKEDGQGGSRSTIDLDDSIISPEKAKLKI